MKVEINNDMAVRELRGFIRDEVLHLKDSDGKNVMLRDGGKITVGVKRGSMGFTKLDYIEALASQRFYAGDTITITLTL